MNSSQSIRFPATEIPVTATSLGMETSAVLQLPSNGVAAIGRGKNSSDVPPPALPTHHSVDWMMRTPPPKPSRVTSSPSSTGLVKGRDDTRRSRGNSLARSIAGPLSRLLHFDGKEVDDGELDFMCRGEVPLRPPRRAGWLGSLEEVPASRATGTADVTVSGQSCAGALGTLGSAWCPENGWTKAGDLPTVTSPFGGSPPPLASSGSSLASVEASLASPSYFRAQHMSSTSPGCYFSSTQSIYLTPPRKNLAKGLGGSNTGPTRRPKISIDTISAPILQDCDTSARKMTTNQH